MRQEEWHPPSHPPMPTGRDSFPASGPNSLAPFGLRAAARSLDVFVLGLPLLLIVSIGLVVSGFDADQDVDRYPAWVAAVWFVAVVTYETVLVAWRGQTLGKLALGLKVARIDNGRPPPWWQAAIRVALPAVIATIPNPLALLGFLAVYFSSMFDPMTRGIHDKAAGTVVVRTR